MNKIEDYIKARGQVTVNDLVDYLGVSRQAVHRQVKKLTQEGTLQKVGRPPKVFYLLAQENKQLQSVDIDLDLKRLIDDNFLVITPAGERQGGWPGFVYWCDRQKLPLQKTAREYGKTVQKYSAYKDKSNGLIDGGYKLKHTFPEVFADKVFYVDFYSIERFGKTKLGQLLLYAKQSQNKNLIKELVKCVKPAIISLLRRHKVDAVGYIPPTVKREVQLMRELERQLNLPLPTINLVKLKTPVVVPQKTLNKLEDRVENARGTIMVDDTKKYQTILLIDDALGSGATLNETAQKIKRQKLATTIIGLAITGSFSGFEVISEV
jgi:biotin operon repressor